MGIEILTLKTKNMRSVTGYGIGRSPDRECFLAHGS
jgi:hypothetical protein